MKPYFTASSFPTVYLLLLISYTFSIFKIFTFLSIEFLSCIFLLAFIYNPVAMMMVIGDRVAEMVTAVISDSSSDADGMLSGHKKSVWNVEYVEQ